MAMKIWRGGGTGEERDLIASFLNGLGGSVGPRQLGVLE